MTIPAIEVIGLILIFLSGFVGVMAPLGFKKGSSYLSYLNLIASGVLVAAALVHLLSDSADTLATAPLLRNASGKPFPWAFAFFGVTFYVMFIFERIILKYHGIDIPIPITEHTRLVNDTSENAGFTFQPDRHKCVNTHHSGFHEEIVVETARNQGIVSGAILMCGLGFHSFLAGIGLGVASGDAAWTAILVAILSHKLLAAIAIGAAFHRAGTVKPRVHGILAVVFGSITPLGAVIGILIGEFVSDWVSAIFLSIASGTFLYVAMYEIVLHEFENSERWDMFQDMSKCCAMFLGFVGMTVLANWT